MGKAPKTIALLLAFFLFAPIGTLQLVFAQNTELVFDHFDFDPIGRQVVGGSFNVTITAKDQYNQTLTSYSKTDYWSTILSIPSINTNDSYVNDFGYTAVFVNGIFNREINLSKGGGETYIRIWDGQKYEKSAPFYVDGPGSLNYFTVTPVNDRQTVGVPFSITITAKDQFGQIFTDYNGVNTWTIFTLGDVYVVYDGGTIGPFVNGVWSGNITLTESTFRMGSARYGETFPAGRSYVEGDRANFNTYGQKVGLPDRPESKAWGKTNDFTILWPPDQTPTPTPRLTLTPTLTPISSPTPTPSVPELSWLLILPLLLSMPFVTILVRHRKTANSKKAAN
jgi:hypothetical protein